MTSQEYEKKLQELQTEIDELKANKPTEYKRWRACEDNKYNFLSSTGSIVRRTEQADTVDDYRYNTGNYFKTEKEAEQHKAYLLALQIIKDDAEGWIPDWEDSYETKWLGVYEYEYKKMSSISFRAIKFQGVIYFETEKKLQHSQKVHKAEWLTVLGVEQ